ncbi:MAG: hypothetical protein R3C44_18820 [Chloroflexota bacterium]
MIGENLPAQAWLLFIQADWISVILANKMIRDKHVNSLDGIGFGAQADINGLIGLPRKPWGCLEIRMVECFALLHPNPRPIEQISSNRYSQNKVEKTITITGNSDSDPFV